MKIIIILLLVCSCAPKAPIVYFKEPKHKIVESDSHKHGRLHSPHYIPLYNDNVSGDIVLKYDLFYKNKHTEHGSKEVNSTWRWIFIYIIMGFLTLI